MGPQGCVEVMHQSDIRRVVQAVAIAQQSSLQEYLLNVTVADLSYGGLLALLLYDIVSAYTQRVPSLDSKGPDDDSQGIDKLASCAHLPLHTRSLDFRIGRLDGCREKPPVSPELDLEPRILFWRFDHLLDVFGTEYWCAIHAHDDVGDTQLVRHCIAESLMDENARLDQVLARYARESRYQGIDALVHLGALLRRAGDDQRRARLVDQDGVDLVDDGVGERALHALLEAEGQVVAQIVEAEFVVGAEGDVAGVGRALLRRFLLAADHTHAEAQEAIDGAHPVGVALGEVLVDRHDVHAVPRQRVQVRRECRDQRLALTGPHFGDLALVEGEPTDELDVEVPHLQHPPRRLAHHGEGLGLQLLEAGARGEALAELVRLGAQLRVGEGGVLFLQAGRLPHGAAEALHEPLVAAPKHSRQGLQHVHLSFEIKPAAPREGASGTGGRNRVLYG